LLKEFLLELKRVMDIVLSTLLINCLEVKKNTGKINENYTINQFKIVRGESERINSKE